MTDMPALLLPCESGLCQIDPVVVVLLDDLNSTVYENNIFQ